MTNERRIIELLLDIIVREKIIDANVAFLTEQVNNANIRLIEIERTLAASTPATGFRIEQQGEENMQVQAGQSGVFQAVPVPTGGALQAGAIPVWSVDDTAEVTLTPSADGLTVSAAVAATAAAASFNLTITGVNSAGATISDTVNVLIGAVAPPPPVPATGFVITQLS